MYGSPGYMYTPPPTQDSFAMEYSTGGHARVVTADFDGTAYRPGHSVTVYGVAMIENWLELYPYRWVYMMQDRLVDSTGPGPCYAIDTVAAELFCFIEQSPVSYADLGYVRSSGDTVAMPIYELYFSHPIQVQAGHRFYVGASHSDYNVYNHIYKDSPYWPVFYTQNPYFVSRRTRYNIPQDPACGFSDGLDSTWCLDKYHWPGQVDWACYVCTTRPNHSPMITGNKYSCHGYYPILHPPQDSSNLIPPHDHPLRAGAVENFRLTELDSAHASFAWAAIPPSDWGLVGVNVNAYQVNYAPYTQAYDEADTLMTAGDSCTLRMTFDSTVMYKARCRAQSRHVCDIHDTVVWGEWSDEVYFHTGVGVPDTAPLVCCRVEGFRLGGLVGGRPWFEWEGCEGADRYAMQYAVLGSSSWRRGPTTTTTDCILNAELDSSLRYMARVRTQCDHRCHVHDTVLEGDWSDTVVFSLWADGIDGAVGDGGRRLFDLAPNPARGSVTVTLAEGLGGGVLTVADAAGREVLRKELAPQTQTTTIGVAELPAGTYFVTLATAEGSGTRKLVVE